MSQPVEDQGVHIPDQTVIKKGKQFPPRYHACFCKLHTHTHIRIYTHTCTHPLPLFAILLEWTRCNAVMPD